MADVTNEPIDEILKSVQRDLPDVKNGIGEIKVELNAVRGHMISLQQDVHNIYGVLARHDARLDWIECRLELSEFCAVVKSAVLVFPGINRERDMARTLKLVSGREPAMVWHADTALPPGTDLVVIPGGFSYGDYLRCGAIAARAPIMAAVRSHAAQGGLVLGVCNGFQILCESGLLPGVLMRNAALKFICKDVYLRVERSDTPFTRGYNAGQVIRVPVAHGEGNYVADEATIARLEAEGRVAFRYAAPDGTLDPRWNVNGATNSIAGILNERGNVLGLMPHPENHVEAMIGPTDGRGLFAGLTQHFAKVA